MTKLINPLSGESSIVPELAPKNAPVYDDDNNLIITSEERETINEIVEDIRHTEKKVEALMVSAAQNYFNLGEILERASKKATCSMTAAKYEAKTGIPARMVSTAFKIYKEMSGGRHGSYNIWHPSKRYIAFSSNSTHQAFYGQSKNKIEVYDLWSDLIVYDIDREQVLQDERFTDSLNLEMFPSFSPDGKWLYFSTAKPVNMPMETDRLHYNIVRVPFDEATGKLGDIDTVYSAYRQGGTAMMPRLTPDGRYMLFSLGECGGFNLYHTESDLKMMDLETGDMVPTDILNSPRSESHHGWSSNGKWVVYMTKRFDGRYTRLMLAYWDGQRFHKPFLLPQQNPEDNLLLLMAYNVPEFIKGPVVVSKDAMANFFTKE